MFFRLVKGTHTLSASARPRCARSKKFSSSNNALKEFPSMHKFFRLCFATLLVFALSALAFAQSTVTGAIGVTATDPQGAVVPNANVKVVNLGTNQETTDVTDGEGRARIVNLQPGTYSLTVEASGFGTFTQDKVIVEVGLVTSVEAALAVGQAPGQVEAQ